MVLKISRDGRLSGHSLILCVDLIRRLEQCLHFQLEALYSSHMIFICGNELDKRTYSGVYM